MSCLIDRHYRSAALGAARAPADRIGARRTQAALDAQAATNRKGRRPHQPEDRGVETRVEGEAGPDHCTGKNRRCKSRPYDDSHARFVGATTIGETDSGSPAALRKDNSMFDALSVPLTPSHA